MMVRLMTITNRLLTFYLLTLAIVLASFSLAILLIERSNLHHQFDTNQNAIMDVVTSAIEEKPDGLEWEPNHRELFQQSEGKPTIWAVFNENNTLVDGSQNYPFPIQEYVKDNGDRVQSQLNLKQQERHWRLSQKSIHSLNPKTINTDQALNPRHLLLTIVLLSDATPIHEWLRNLAWTLTIASGIVWLIAALLGKWLCRRALSPLTDVCDSIKNIGVENLSERITVPSPKDELKELAVSFNDLLSRVHEAFERQRQFTGHASHQLRTPLAGMLGQVEVALLRDREPGEYRRVLMSLQERGIHLKAIVETMLFLSRADVESNLPDLSRVDLAEWLPNHLQTVWGDHPRYSNLVVEPPTIASLMISTHPVLLGQAIDTLIDNAFKYSFPNTPIAVHLDGTPENVSIQVISQGSGIPLDDQQNIFLPFFRSREAQHSGVPGVGLGLSIAYRIMESLKGEITLESQSKEKTTFTLHFRAPFEDKK
jgi:signal transduction histidine kinase